MPSLQLRQLNQKAVLWMVIDTGQSSGFDDMGRHIIQTAKAAVEIMVRWEEDRMEAVRNRLMVGSEGNTVAVDAVVVVDRDIIVGSIMWLGAKNDLATPPVDLYEVRLFTKIPSVKGRKFRRRVGLTKYSDSLPAIA